MLPIGPPTPAGPSYGAVTGGVAGPDHQTAPKPGKEATVASPYLVMALCCTLQL